MTRPTFDPTRISARRERRVRCRALGVGLLAFLLLALGCRAQNGNDSVAAAAGVPTANFTTADPTTGTIGLVVQFTDTSTGDVTSYLWDFGAAGTSTLQNPQITFATAGTFDVSLTVTGARGNSVKQVVDLIVVVDVPTAGFACGTTSGFAPLAVTCASSAVGASATTWTFTNTTTSDTVVSNDPNASVSLTTAGLWTVRQDVSNAAGAATETQADLIDVDAIGIAVAPLVGPGPGTATLTADTGGFSGLGTWLVDGVSVANVSVVGGVPSSTDTNFSFPAPGTYVVTFAFASLFPPIDVQTTFDYVVADVGVSADFSVAAPKDTGPVDVVFTNLSLGLPTSGTWVFGDGATCDYPVPDPAPADLSPYCDSPSPTHTYASVGHFDVSLTVNPGAADADTATQPNAVTVTILDPSFEEQDVATEIAKGWTALKTGGAATEHVALSQTEAGGADAGMPRGAGDQWAALDGLGTNGSEPVLSVAHGIETTFVLPAGRPVLAFDYVLLFSEPPAGLVRDAMTATVSDGSADPPFEVTTAAADAWSAYGGGSTRYPTLDGSTTRVTPIRVATLDVEKAFPTATADTVFTLTIRLTNDVNAFRPPRAYVDDVRFIERSTSPITASFTAPATVVAGAPVDFMDTTICDEPMNPACADPTAWRWDFDTRESIVPPMSTGSALQDPTYVFDEAGDYDVTLWAQVGERVSQDVMTVSVIEAPVAIPIVESVVASPGSWDVDARSDSTSDPTDPIVDWSWDFAGWGTSTVADPGAVTVGQAGTLTIRLTVTTAAGLEATGSVDVDLN